MELKNMKDLEDIVNKAIELNSPLGLVIEMPGFSKPELITNPVENLEKKFKYWKNTYDENLEHVHAKGIKIIAYTFY